MAQTESTKGHPTANEPTESIKVIETVIAFLKIFMPETLAKRVVSIVLIAAGLTNSRVTELTGYCDRSVRGLRKDMREGDVSRLLSIRGGGRRSKTAGLEDEILAELEKGNYQTRQQIADMILEKFHISMSPSAVGNFLKKTASKS